jgi:recombination protein RecA
VAPPFREAEFDIIYGKGISRSGELVDIASANGIIDKSGSWFAYQGDRLGQGRENAKAALEQNPELMQEIFNKVKEKLDTNPGAVGTRGEDFDGE